MKNSTYLFLIIFCFVTKVNRETFGENAPLSDPTFILKHALMDYNDHIRSWYVEYQLSWKNDSGSYRYMHRFVEAKSNGDFFHWNGHGSDSVSWQRDPLQQRATLGISQSENEFVRQRLYFTLKSGIHDALPGSLSQDYLWVVLGWWPYKNRPGPVVGQTPCVLPEIASSANYNAQPDQLSPDGSICHILEWKGHDKIWLDSKSVGLIKRRELFDPDTGKPVIVMFATESREIEPGICIPSEMNVCTYNSAISNTDPTILAYLSISILDVRLNDKVPPIIPFVPAPGSVQIFDDGHFQQTVPGGTDLMDEVATDIPLFSTNYHSNATVPFAHTTEYIVELILTIAGIILLVRRRRKIRVS